MSEVRKAAILLTCLPEAQAAQILARLTPKQVESVTIQIAHLGQLSAAELATVAQEFAESNRCAFGGLEVAEALVEKAFGDKPVGAPESLKQSRDARPFHFLQSIDPQNLLTYILDEHPQTIALILSHLPPAYGAEIVKGLPTDRQLAVIRRIANMGQTSPEVIQEVERGLERRMGSLMNQSFQKTGGIGSVAEILNVTDRTTGRMLLESLSQEDPALVEEIRRRMFTFEDLGKMSDRDMQSVLKNVETSQWALALKGASANLKQRILANMSQRAGGLLQEEMEYLGAVRVSEVQQVQQQIVDIVRRLEEAGEITVQAPEESEEFVQ